MYREVWLLELQFLELVFYWFLDREKEGEVEFSVCFHTFPSPDLLISTYKMWKEINLAWKHQRSPEPSVIRKALHKDQVIAVEIQSAEI